MLEQNEIDEIAGFIISLFVEKKELFDKILNEINQSFSQIKNYHYDYDDFCKDYLRITIKFFKNHPDVDYNDMSIVSFYTNIIIGELFLELRTKYKNNDESNNS
jgi:hypothetical protein